MWKSLADNLPKALAEDLFPVANSLDIMSSYLCSYAVGLVYP